MVTLGGFFVLLLDVARKNFRVNPYLHGSARWAGHLDIKAASLLNNDGVEVGAWRDKGGKIHYLRHAGPEHVLCYAPTRSGKGVGLIVPTLLSWKQSVFVTDLKGELYELTAGWRHEYGHNKILRFEPAAATGSCCFNPLDELRIGTEHEVGDVQNLALLIVDPDGKGLRSDSHWQKTAYSLLVGCILHLCYKAKVEGPPAKQDASRNTMNESTPAASLRWRGTNLASTEQRCHQTQGNRLCRRLRNRDSYIVCALDCRSPSRPDWDLRCSRSDYHRLQIRKLHGLSRTASRAAHNRAPAERSTQ